MAAKHNQIHLFGQVADEVKKTVTGNKLRYFFVMNVMRKSRGGKDETVAFDCPMIMVGEDDESIVAKVEALSKGDIIDVKGFITSRNIKKIRKCTHCGREFSSIGTMMFITPVNINIYQKQVPENIANDIMKANVYVSNEALLIGNVTAPPHFYKEGNYRNMTFQIGVNRKFYIKDDNPQTKSDYVFVNSYGETADKDNKFLKTSTLVLVDGSIITKKFEREEKCPNCNMSTKWKDWTMEITSYANEYLAGMVSDEEQAAADAEKAKAMRDEIFGS